MKTLIGILLLIFSLSVSKGYTQKFLRFENEFQILDTSVCGAVYNDFASIQKIIKDSLQFFFRDERYTNDENGFLAVTLTNTCHSERLRLSLIAGNSCCQIFDVYASSCNKKSDSKIVLSDCSQFVTEAGVRLGMTSDEFFKNRPLILFERITLGKSVIYRYYGDIHVFLGKVWASYVSLYKFEDEKLVEFIFGRYNNGYDYIKAIMNNNPLYKKYNEIYSDDWFK